MELKAIIDGVIAAYGFDPQYIYCTHTGRPVGAIDISELEMTLLTMRATDLETAVDEMAMRVLSFARPAPAWGHMTPDTLEYVRIRQPQQLLAYLLNRLYEPRDNAASKVPVTHAQRIRGYASKIRMWAELTKLSLDEAKLNRLLMVLLEMDSRIGLHILTPKNIPMLPTWGTVEGFKRAIDAFESWRDHLRADIAKFEAQKKSEIAWARDPNRMTAKPFVKQFWESKPPSESQKKKLAKAADLEMLSELFDSLSTGKVVKLPEPAPVTPGLIKAGKIVRFGVKGA